MAELLTLGAIALGAAAVWQFLRRREQPFLEASKVEALHMLERRYVRGEIDQREFEERRRALGVP